MQPSGTAFHMEKQNPFKQRRLDFFLISDSLQELAVDSDIILSVLSDHSFNNCLENLHQQVKAKEDVPTGNSTILF